MSFCANRVFQGFFDLSKCPFDEEIPYSLWRYYGEDSMQKYRKHYMEVLAPASATTYKTAVDNGADAIYFGYGTLNARAGAKNVESFDDIVDFCHLHGVKAYLALNIMLKNGEIDKAKEIIIKAEQAKIDAFIISDLSLVPIIRRYSKAALHASTQMGIHNKQGALFAKNLGFDRIVLSREVTAEDIKDITDNVCIEVELFAHGALCVAFSGACLISSMLTGKSGNRGRCNQLCRMLYSEYFDGKKVNEGYLLSAKDICMGSLIRELNNMGVNSLKIEGRVKSSEYIAGVTGVYDELASNKHYNPFTEGIESALKILFNRGNFTRGYFDGSDIIYPDFAGHMGLRCGKIVKIISKNLVLIQTDREIFEDDCFKAIRDGKDVGGLVAEGVQVINGKVYYVARTYFEARVGDVLFVTKSLMEIRYPKKTPIEIMIRIVGGEPVRIMATCRHVKLDYTDLPADRALTKPLTDNEIQEQFGKTGNSEFVFDFVNVYTNDAFMGKKQLNDLRRMVLDYFEKHLVEDYPRLNELPQMHRYKDAPKIQGDFIELDDLRNYSEYVKKNIKNIVYSPNNYDYDKCKEFYENVKTNENTVFIKFPIFIPSAKLPFTEHIIRLFDGVVANNLGVFNQAQALNKLVVAGWALNISNEKNPLIKLANQSIVSVELNTKELKKFPNCLVYAFGRLPLMYLNYCPKRLGGLNCADCKKVKTVTYRDNKGEYLISTKKLDGYCQHELRNSVITNLGKMLETMPRYFDFCGFKRTEVDAYLKKYFFGKNPESAVGFNHLHLTRGVE